MEFAQIAARLKGRLFLSSMMEVADAEFCASRAAGCAMVQLGAFVLMAEHTEHDTYWPDRRPEQLAAHLKSQFDACRAESAKRVGPDRVPLICANVFPCTDEDLAVSADAFIRAGGDLYELNSHGGVGDDRRRGTGAMLFIPQHTPKLMRWARMLVEAGGPVVIKARGGAIPDYTDHVRRLEELGVHAFHINVREKQTGRQHLRLLESVRKATGMFLLASGYVTDAATARALFDAGADCVGIAEVARADPDIFVKCQP